MYTPDERIYFFVERIANTDLNSVSVQAMAQEYRDLIVEAKEEIERYNTVEQFECGGCGRFECDGDCSVR